MADRALRQRRRSDGPILVIGLGRFGSALATTLAGMGHDVLAVDSRGDRVQSVRDTVTHAVEADTTDVEALRQIGAPEFGRAVVAIGADIEASILTASALVDLGVPQIWAKAMTSAHARILERIGAHHVVFPEAEMGSRVAHLVSGHLLDFLPLDSGFALVESVVPASMTGRSLGELGVRSRYGITVVCVKPSGGRFTYATADTVLGAGDVIVVAGETERAERFADLP